MTLMMATDQRLLSRRLSISAVSIMTLPVMTMNVIGAAKTCALRARH
jgi:hypothetical protein